MFRIQVKSRMASDSGNFTIKPNSLKAVDYYAFVIMGLGVMFRRDRLRVRQREEHPAVFLVPKNVVARALSQTTGSRGRTLLFTRERQTRWAEFRGRLGVDQLAQELGVPYPLPPRLRRTGRA
jgi:hypothetical protein